MYGTNYNVAFIGMYRMTLEWQRQWSCSSRLSSSSHCYFSCRTHYAKIDQQAIQLSDVSCFADAVECLVKLFYVLDLAYPHELKPTYGFLEKLMGLKVSIGKSTALADFIRKIGL